MQGMADPSLSSGLCPHLVEGNKQVSGAEPVDPSLVWGLPEAPAHPQAGLSFPASRAPCPEPAGSVQL